MNQSGQAELSWDLLEDKQKRPCLKIANRSIESGYDAIEQSGKTADQIIAKMQSKNSSILIVIGLGLAYLAQSLFDRNCQHVVFYDPFPQMRRSLPTVGGPWREKYRVVFTIQGLFEELKKHIDDRFLPELFIYPGYEPYTRFEYRQILDLLRNLYAKNDFNNYLVSERSIESLSNVPFFRPFSNLSRYFVGQTAVLISAGPSLKSAIEYLKSASNCFVFAALQVLPLLQKEGISVDFVVVADPQDLSGIQKNCSLSFKALLSDSLVHPKTLNWCPEKTFVYNLFSDHFHQLFWDQIPGNNIRAPMSTVSETQLCLALGMGFEKILLLGMDYGWKKNRYAHRCLEAPKEAPYERRFPICLEDGSFAETEAMYYHGFRFMNYLCSSLKGRVWQYSECLKLSTVSSLNLHSLQSFFKGLKTNKIMIPEGEIDKNSISLAEDLIRQAAVSRHTASRDLEKSFFDSDKYMPFFKETHPTKRAEICEQALHNLRRQGEQFNT